MNDFSLSQLFGKSIRIVLLLAVLLLSFGSRGTSIAYAAPPAHDDFDSAKEIDSITYHDTNVNTTEATPSDTAPNVDDPDNFQCEGENFRYGFASVWYQYTPPEDQSLTLNTIGTTPPQYDTFIAVWTGTRGNLNIIDCNDDNFEGVSELSFTANGGTTYYIEIAQFNDGLGTTDAIGGNLVFNAYITNTDVYVKGILRGRYFVPETGGLRRSFINLNSGPVMIDNVANNQIIASERVIYNVNGVDTSFSEMMGLPSTQLDNVYWMPWYNNKTLGTQIRFGNVSNSQTATVHVFIGGTEVTGSPYALGPGASLRKLYNLDKGPVKIDSNINIVASERVIYNINGVDTSFSEMMGLPESQLDNVYWMPWYNNKTLDTQLRIANVSGTPATVNVWIGGIKMTPTALVIPVGGSKRLSYNGVDRGPVQIVSDVNIVAAERVIYKLNGVPVSFTEMMGLPENQLDNTYYFPWYNNKTLETQLRFANVSGATAHVHVYIGGIEVANSPFTLLVGQSTRQSFVNIDRGPVKIESDQNIVAAERVIYKVNNKVTSFSEMMGLPNGSLDTTYWMPWYNNFELSTQLRFALP